MALHLPAPRFDEILTGVVARYRRYLHIQSLSTMSIALTGRLQTTARLGLPAFLDGPEWILGERTFSPDELIDHFSVYRYVTAFAPGHIREQVRRALKSGQPGVQSRLGLTGFRIGTEKAPKFCPHCVDEMVQSFPDIWVQRAHQLSGVAVCHLHGTPLRVSQANKTNGSSWMTQPAIRQHCFDGAESIVDEAANEAELAGLQRLAKAATALLWTEQPALSHAARQARYRTELRRCGFLRDNGAVDHRRFNARLIEHWGEGFARVPSTRFLMSSAADWLAPMIAGSKLSHPLLHLIVEGALSACPDAPLLFGHGPWTCRNPFSDHVDEPVIEEVVVKRVSGQMAGDFACSCGYIYRRLIAADGSVGRPHCREFGPLFPEAFANVLAQTRNIKLVARTLRMGRRKMLREALRLGIPVPWKTEASLPFREPARSGPWRPSCPRVRNRAPGPMRRRRNWPVVDAELATKINEVAAAIRAAMPPIRLTVAEVERQLGMERWIEARRCQLPLTNARLSEISEDFADFRRRREQWRRSAARAAYVPPQGATPSLGAGHSLQTDPELGKSSAISKRKGSRRS